CSQGILADERAVLNNGPSETAVIRWINLVNAAAQDGDGASVSGKGAIVSDGIDAQCQPADNGNAGGNQIATQRVGHVAAINRGAARADNSNGPTVIGLEVAAHVEERRRRINMA